MGAKSPVAAALEAVDEGKLSVEEVVRSALAGTESFKSWLNRRLKVRMTGARRSVRLRKEKYYSNEVASAAVKAVRRLLKGRSDVVSIHWGARQLRGRATSEPAVIVYVSRKLTLREVSPADRLPRKIEFSSKKSKHRIPIDVQGAGLPGSLLSVSSAMPGERAAVLIGTHSSVDGSLGVLVDVAGTGLLTILAGHVAQQMGLSVRGQFGGQPPIDLGVVRAILSPPTGDAAVAGPSADPTSALNLLVSPSAPFRDPENQDLTFTVFVHTLGDFNPKQSSIDGIGVTGLFGQGGTTVTIDGLVALQPAVANPGDSGGPVLDGSGTIVGFVVGNWNGKTYIMPARRAIDALVP